MFTRITNFKAAESALIQATGLRFPSQYNFLLTIIAEKYVYKLPQELSHLFFAGREGYERNHEGFGSPYGIPFTLALKLFQLRTIELALTTLDQSQQGQFLEKIKPLDYKKSLNDYRESMNFTGFKEDISDQTSAEEWERIYDEERLEEEFIKNLSAQDYQLNLKQYKTEDQLAHVLDDLLEMSSQALSSEGRSSDNKTHRQLDFSVKLIRHLRDNAPTQELMNRITTYKKSLSSSRDAELIDLLGNLCSSFSKPTGMFRRYKPAKQELNGEIEKLKSHFIYSYDRFKNDLNYGNWPNPERAFASYFIAYHDDINKHHLEMQNFTLKGEDEIVANISTTFASMLEELANSSIRTDDRPSTNEQALELLGLNPDELINKNNIITQWKNAQNIFCAWYQKYDQRDPRSSQACQAFILKFLAYKWLEKNMRFPAQEMVIDPLAKIFNLSEEPSTTPQPTFTIEEERYLTIKNNYTERYKRYLSSRGVSTWLIEHNLGFIVQWLSPLRFHKITQALAFINELTAEESKASSTSVILNSLPVNALEQIVKKHHDVQQYITDSVIRYKSTGNLNTVRSRLDYQKKHDAIPLPFFWRLSNKEAEGWKVREEHEYANSHDGQWYDFTS